MAAGNIFMLMVNDGRQDVMLNATEKLLKQLNEIKSNKIQYEITKAQQRFDKPPDKNDTTYIADKHIWMTDRNKYIKNKPQLMYNIFSEIDKTHTMYIGKCFKPFVAMSFNYLKVLEKEGQPKFSGEVSYIIPHMGTWIHDMVLHVRLTNLTTNSQDKVKYCGLLGHRLIKQVQFMINGVIICEYGTEHMNKHFGFHVRPEKKQAWLRNVGQEIPQLAYITPNPSVDEFREYRYFGNGPQTFKRTHDEVDMYIPLLFWFNLDVAQSFLNCMIPKGNVKINIKFGDLSELVQVANYGGNGTYTPPVIYSDLYVNHICTLPEIQQIITSETNYSLIRVTKSFTQTLQNINDNVLLKELKFPVEHIAICFRPDENLQNIDNWYKSMWLTQINELEPTIINGGTMSANYAIYYSEEHVVDKVGISLNDIEIHPFDTVNKYSAFHPYAAPGIMVPDDRGWLFFTHQFNNSYDPSGHLNLSRNREIRLTYQSSRISDLNKVQLYVDAQCINFLIVNKGTAKLVCNI